MLRKLKPTTVHFHKGFTLIEVLIVLFILGISSAIVIPMLFFSIENITFKTSVKRLAALMRFARSEAINHKSIQVLELNIKEGSYILKETKIGGGFNTNKQEESKQTSSDGGARFNTFPGGGNDETGKTSSLSNKIYNVTHKLADNIGFDMIQINNTKMKDGTAKIYFFPKGNTSGGKIFIANKRKKIFSISIDRITGHVVVKKEDKDYYS